MAEARVFWTPQAWVDGRWQAQVLLECGAGGDWDRITPGVATAPPGATVLAGPALPGLVDAHSHAFQRAFAGLTERREQDSDDFWSWRDRMYGVALRITPTQLQAVAAQLYVELLQGGYTQVCEFHYLQHDVDGLPYADPATLAWSLCDAAEATGIGLTVLPVLYERAGFDRAPLRHDQRRFRSTPAEVQALYRDITAARRARVNAGVAIHSLRGASPESIADLLRQVGDADLPVHIHVAEQTAEVDACLAETGQRPIEHLCHGAPGQPVPDARWQLVHATHATPAEIDAVALAGAGIVLCPSTEANLGDGVPDLPRWLAADVPLSLGSDSQVARSWAEELRWLEYAQRLVRRVRNVGAAPERGQASTAGRLVDAVLAGGGHAAGQHRWGFAAGARADLLVLDAQAPGLLGLPSHQALDGLVFATDAPAFSDVFVGGEQVVSAGRHVAQARIAARFSAVMGELWEGRAD